MITSLFGAFEESIRRDRRFMLAAFCLGLVGLAGPASGADRPNPPTGFRALFTGEDLAGWYGSRPDGKATGVASSPEDQASFRAHWRVEDGALVNDGHGLYATTAEQFGDIELHIEYKTVAKADSGIYLRGSPQVQIWDFTEAGGKWDRGADKGSGGLFNNAAGSAGRHPLVLADKPFGEWNKFRIIQVGSRTTVFLNDRLVVDNSIMENLWGRESGAALPARGPIHLQTHGGEIQWRNLYVREIKSDEANALLRGSDADKRFASLFNGRDLSGWQGATDNYEIRDGAIVCKEGKGGVLYGSETYGDFQARLEFKLPPGGNNGLAIRYPGEGDAAYGGMCELQVIDNTAEKYAELDARQYHASAYGMVPAQRGYLRPVGQWNYQEVTVRGPTIKVELNGTVILDADLSTVSDYMADSPHPGKDRTEGYFGFAGHSDPVMFRAIAVRKL